MSKDELTNMCMVYDKDNNKVLVIDRMLSWKDITFPGGHVEDGESIVESTIREIKEETGLIIKDLKQCGIINWFIIDTKERYLVFLYKTTNFYGDLLKETKEGKVYWVNLDELPSLKLSDGMKERLPMIFEDDINEGFANWSLDKVNKLNFL